MEEARVLVLLMFPCDFRRGEVAQKFEVVGAASVDPKDRSKDAPTVTSLTKFAFAGSLLAWKRLVDNSAEVTCSLVEGRVSSQVTTVRDVGVVV